MHFPLLHLRRRPSPSASAVATAPRAPGRPPRRSPSTGVAGLPGRAPRVPEGDARPRVAAGQARAAGPALRPGAWATAEPPITQPGDAEFDVALRRFDASLDGWEAKGQRSLRNLFKPNRQKSAWNTRLRDLPLALAHRPPGAVNAVYQFAGEPVGLMSASRPRDAATGAPVPYVEIHALASHPGTEGVGGALVEHAVGLSQASGANGVVRVSTLPAARAAYEAMGFRDLGHGVMELDPARQDLADNGGKWARLEGRWQLRKHAGKPYIQAFGQASAASGPLQVDVSAGGGLLDELRTARPDLPWPLADRASAPGDA